MRHGGPLGRKLLLYPVVERQVISIYPLSLSSFSHSFTSWAPTTCPANCFLWNRPDLPHPSRIIKSKSKVRVNHFKRVSYRGGSMVRELRQLWETKLRKEANPWNGLGIGSGALWGWSVNNGSVAIQPQRWCTRLFYWHWIRSLGPLDAIQCQWNCYVLLMSVTE